MEKIKLETVHDGYKMGFFLCQFIAYERVLEKAIDITIERIYDRKEIDSQITRPEMEKLLTLFAKIVHFTFDNQVYQQKDGVTMESPLGQVLTGIFIVWFVDKRKKRFADDNIVYITNGSIDILMIMYYY